MESDDPLSAFRSAGEVVPGAMESKSFGAPCFKVGSKVFCWFFDAEMVFKLDPADVPEALSYDGARLFDPSGKGKPMKAWVQLPFEYAEEWPDWARRAAQALPAPDPTGGT